MVKRNLPSVEDDFTTPVEHELRNKYQAEIELLYQNGKQVLDDLEDKNFNSINHNLEELTEEKIEQQVIEAGITTRSKTGRIK